MNIACSANLKTVNNGEDGTECSREDHAEEKRQHTQQHVVVWRFVYPEHLTGNWVELVSRSWLSPYSRSGVGGHFRINTLQ